MKPAKATPQAGEPIEFKPALNPQPRLFVTLCAVFALWVAALIGIYLKTVYPMHHTTPATLAPATAR